MRPFTTPDTPSRLSRSVWVALGAAAALLVAQPEALRGGSTHEKEPPTLHREFRLPDGAASQLNELLAELGEQDEPGLAAAVFHDGRMLYAGTRGSANLDHDIRLSESSRFYAASLSKQVTAAAAAVLLARGDLALSDRVGDILESWPDWAEDVRVEHLIYHTAGLPDFIELLELADLSIADPLNLNDYLEVITRAGALNHDPGERFQFSNSNYLVLAAVVEGLSNRSLNAFATEHLFEPLGMKDTHFHDDRRRVIPQRVIGYRTRNADSTGGFAQAYINTYQEYGAGGLYTTVEDWSRWDTLRSGDPLGLGSEICRLLVRPGKTAGDSRVDYAFGLQLDRWNELARIGHDGRFMGFHHDYRYFPQLQVSVVVFSNRSDLDAGVVLKRISEIIFAEHLEAWMQPYIGRFTNRELDVAYELTAESGRLYLHRPNRDPAPLTYSGSHRWRMGTWLLEFTEPVGEEPAPQFKRFYLSTIRAFGVEFERR